MINPKLIRENPEKIKLNTQQRNVDPGLVDMWLEADAKRAQIQKGVEQLNKEKNELAAVGKKGGNVDELRNKGKELKERARKLEDDFATVDVDWKNLLLQIPNIHAADVPIGKSDKENVVVRKIGDIPEFKFTPKDHLQLGTALGMLDFDAGAKVSGSQFCFLKGDAVLLEYALALYGLQFFVKKGFTPVITPDLAKSRYYLGTGYAPRGDEAQTYEIKDEDLGLIATAEITMAGMHADEIIDEEKLPLKYAAISHCFRKEAGAYGKYSKGLYRVHQFTKLEMFVYCLPEQSEELSQQLLGIEEEIAQALKLPYQVVQMCSGDLGAMAARKYDLEAWMPGRNDYGEITSTSNCTDYQARNLDIRFKRKNGEKDYLHMLNGTAIVMSRFPLAIMENYQQQDGTIKVPDVLKEYVGKEYLGK